MNCRIVVKDEVWCIISGLLPSHITELWDAFGVYVEGYRWMPAFQRGVWDGKIRFFEKTGKTYTRLLEQIIPFIDAWGYEFELVDERKFYEPPNISGLQTIKFDDQGLCIEATHDGLFDGVYLGDKPFKLRPYQVQTIKTAVEAGSGFVLAGTGGGKTSITAGLTEIYGLSGYKAITIVPSDDLVTQTFQWYELLGIDVGRYSGSVKDLNHQHVVATWQALQNNSAVLEKFQVVIWDEAHGAKAEVAQRLLNEAGKHIAFRFGVTGTFPKPETDQLTLHATIGNILITIPASWLIENGYLAIPEIQEIELNETYVSEEFSDYSAEKSFLAKSSARMEKIADLIISEAAQYGNTLVLVNNIQFGKKLSSLIKNSVFLYGASSTDLRKEHYDMFETHDDLIVIANSQIASTGISIDRIFCLVLVDSGKGFVRAIQSIGRSLRIGRDKTHARIVDVHSKLKHARKHWRERKRWYTEAKYPLLPKQVLKVEK